MILVGWADFARDFAHQCWTRAQKREGRTPWHRRVYAYGVKVYGRDCAKTFPISRLYGHVTVFRPVREAEAIFMQ